jgi:cytochrome c oxidase subunit 3
MYKNTIKQTHSFHLVDPSPYPFFAACSALLLTISFTASIRHYNYSFDLLCFSLIMLIIVASLWWANVVREGTYEGQHTKRVKKGLMLGMLLFIVSEVMFFFSFFLHFFM